MHEALRYYTQARDRYYELKPQHDLLRHDFLLARLNDPSLDDAHHKAIARLMRLEHLRDTFRRIRYLRHPSKGSSISQVEVTSPTTGNTQLHSDKNSVELALCQALQHRFKKAHGSPFLHEPLVNQVGLFGEGPAAKAILEGTFECPPNLDEYTTLFIQALRFPDTQS